MQEGSPVHAGIDLNWIRKEKRLARFPRTRGDRPVKTVYEEMFGLVPPYTRG